MSADVIADCFCPCGEYLVILGTPESRERAIKLFLEWHDDCQPRLMGGDVRFNAEYRRFAKVANAVRAIAEASA